MCEQNRDLNNTIQELNKKITNLENLNQQEAEQISSLKLQHLTDLSNISNEKQLVRNYFSRN